MEESLKELLDQKGIDHSDIIELSIPDEVLYPIALTLTGGRSAAMLRSAIVNLINKNKGRRSRSRPGTTKT